MPSLETESCAMEAMVVALVGARLNKDLLVSSSIFLLANTAAYRFGA